jgi:histidyl-tRNA synthetase
MGNYFSQTEEGYNELHKIGGEIIGENDPILDAILIYTTYSVLKKIGLEDKFTIKVNSI